MMKILLTGATGYIGSHLLPALLNDGHEVTVVVRNKSSFHPPPDYDKHLHIIEADLLDRASLDQLPKDIDVAYYLVHSMSEKNKNFMELEEKSALYFIDALRKTSIKQIVFLSGITNDKNLSQHLLSRQKVEKIIENGGIPYTILKAGIIVGSGSASFEIIRDLVEKLPIMVAPKWVNNHCQPLALQDVLFYLRKVIGDQRCLNKVFELGGPDILTYKEMLLGYASVRGLKRWIISVPVLTPRLSSYWLYFVTSTNFRLATSLVDSLKNEAACKESSIREIFPHRCLSYLESVKCCLEVDVDPPIFGVLSNTQSVHTKLDREQIIHNLWSIGRDNGWYFLNWAWKLRGWFDRLIGGVGLRREAHTPHDLVVGDTLDFWRIIRADKENGDLLLFAEMKVPGEAWLEFKILPDDNGEIVFQKATFRPRGLLGRLYWYLALPVHLFVFYGMARKIADKVSDKTI